MLSARWTCARCLRVPLKAQPIQFLRKASTDSKAILPPVLLQRARALAAEHGDLTLKLAADYDEQSAKRAGDIANVVSALREWEKASSSLTELRSLLTSQDAEMRQMAQEEISSTNDELVTLSKNLSTSLAPKDPYADLPCLLEVRPGPGGVEARLFADALFQMYKGLCSRRGYSTRILKYEVGDGTTSPEGEMPLLEAVLEIQSAGAYNIFRGEAGMHRVQRVPATEAKGRTHTSAVAVWVLPSFPEDNTSLAGNDFNNPDSDFYIDPAEVRSEKMRASGAGGQHVNKTESAIRLTHIPTGTTVSMQDQRSQIANRIVAWSILRSRVASQRREARQQEARNLKDSVLAKNQITRGDKIRTYNYGQDRCTDHRAGLDMHNLPNVLEGGECLDKVMEAVGEWLKERDLEAMMAEQEVVAAPDSSTKR